MSSKVRLQKVLADAGLASRRNAEEMILSGRVTIDGEIVHTLPSFVDPSTSDIRVDGRRIASEKKVYLALNKPRGYVCTSGKGAAKRAVDLAPRGSGRLHTVGRLDVASEGLILLTNDGDLTNIATHPRYRIPKTYEVSMRSEVDDAVLEKLRRGVHLSEGRASCASAKITRGYRGKVGLAITLTEGRNRQIRRMLAACGVKVKRLRRVSIGIIRLGRLKPGMTRGLTAREVKYLKGLQAK